MPTLIQQLRMMADDSDRDFPNSADGSVMREAAAEIERLNSEASEARRLSLELYTVTTAPAVRRAQS